MYCQVFFFGALAFFCSVGPQNVEGISNACPGYEMALSKAESRLKLASKMLDNAKTELRNDLKYLCQNNTCSVKSSGCGAGGRTYHNEKPMDCGDIYKDGYRKSGIYRIWPQSKISDGPLLVYCDMEDGGGWTVIQRRGDFGNELFYFFQGWETYKTGFGHLLREFWIGNDNLFSLTSQGSYQLKVDLRDWDGNTTYATYDQFWIDGEIHNYTLHIKEYKGTAGDSLKRQSGSSFSTKDRDNDNHPDESCSQTFFGAWWYNGCMDSNLNGLNLGTALSVYGKGVMWSTFRGFSYSLKDSVMKIRAADFGDNNIVN